MPAFATGCGLMPEANRPEKLRIWRPEVANLAEVSRVTREVAGAERVGRQVSRFSESGRSQIKYERPFNTDVIIQSATAAQGIAYIRA